MRIYDHTGEKIGTWTVVGIIPNCFPKTYLLKCECGEERQVTSQKFYRKSECKFCLGKSSVEAHLGERNGKITCIGHVHKNKRHCYLVKCDCGFTYTIDSYHQFIRTKCCASCRHGFFPGKKVGKSTCIRRLNGREWEKKCECGNIFVGDSRKTHCGCQILEKTLTKAKSKIGLKFNYLKVIGFDGFKEGRLYLKVKCKCGKIISRINGHEFKSKSCGCYLGIPTGENAAKATLTNAEVNSVRELYDTGLYTEEQLGEMINKDKYYVRRIIRKKIWKQL